MHCLEARALNTQVKQNNSLILPPYHLRNNRISNIRSTEHVTTTVTQISLEKQISTYCMMVSHRQWISSHLRRAILAMLARSAFSLSTKKRKAISFIYVSKHLPTIPFYHSCARLSIHSSIHSLINLSIHLPSHLLI